MKNIYLRSHLTSICKSMLAFGLIALLVTSCGDVSFNGPQSGNGHIDFHLIDAPEDYDEVNVDIQGLRIHYTPAESDTTSSEGEGEWIDLPFEPMRVNLLTLSNGVDSLLSSADLEPGHYRELRLILGDDNEVVIDSTSYNLEVPSGQQSGYKIKFNTDLESGEDIDVVIDFDAARSIHEAGASGKYILKPVLRAFVSSGDEVETGSIIGLVEPCKADARIYAIMDDDTVSTQPDTTGAFKVAGLMEGMYDVNIHPCNESYADTTVTGVMVEPGEETDIGTITLSEN